MIFHVYYIQPFSTIFLMCSSECILLITVLRPRAFYFESFLLRLNGQGKTVFRGSIRDGAFRYNALVGASTSSSLPLSKKNR